MHTQHYLFALALTIQISISYAGDLTKKPLTAKAYATKKTTAEKKYTRFLLLKKLCESSDEDPEKIVQKAGFKRLDLADRQARDIRKKIKRGFSEWHLTSDDQRKLKKICSMPNWEKITQRLRGDTLIAPIIKAPRATSRADSLYNSVKLVNNYQEEIIVPEAPEAIQQKSLNELANIASDFYIIEHLPKFSDEDLKKILIRELSILTSDTRPGREIENRIKALALFSAPNHDISLRFASCYPEESALEDSIQKFLNSPEGNNFPFCEILSLTGATITNRIRRGAGYNVYGVTDEQIQFANRTMQVVRKLLHIKTRGKQD